MYTANKIKTFRPAHGQGYELSRTLLIFCLLITVLFCLTAASNTASAATYYLADPKGADGIAGTADDVDSSDSYPGTSEQPWATIEYTEEHAVNGSTVKLRTGYYGEVVIDSSINRNSWDEGLVFEPDDGHEPVLDKLEFNYFQDRYLTFKNISIIAPDDSDYSSAYDGVVRILKSSHIRIINCTVRGRFVRDSSGGLTQYGLIIRNDDRTNGQSDILIEGCDISGSYRGLAVSGELRDNIVIKNNHVHIVASTIISVGTYADRNSEILIEGNHLHDRRKSINEGNGSHGAGIYFGGHHITIRGNFLHDFGGSGSISAYGTYVPDDGYKDILIENNLIYDPQGTMQLTFYGIAADVIVRNNTFIGWDKGIYTNHDKYGTVAKFIPFDTINGATNVQIYNNIFVGLVEFHDNLGDFTEDNNIYWALKHGSILSTPYGENSKIVYNTDPNYFESSGNFFVGGELFDQYSFKRIAGGAHKQNLNDAYQLANGSDAIGFANPAYAPASDILGVSRVFPPDAGCYEYIPSDSNGQHSLTVSSTSGGSVTTPGEEGPYSYDHGSEVSIEAAESLNYHFVNWTGTAVDAGKVANPNIDITTVTIDANYTLQANFAIDQHQHTLEVSSTSGGTVTNPGEGQFSYDHGSEVSIEAKEGLNYHFVNWTGTAVDAGKVAEPSDASTTVMIDADYKIQANFAIDQHQHTLEVSSTSGGTVTNPGEGQFSYDHGSEVSIGATAADNYHFVNWTGTAVDADKVSEPSNNSTTVTIDANYTIQANFVIDEIDETAPTVTNLSPQADSIQAPLNTLVILDITDSGDGVDANSVTINVNDNIVYSGNTAKYNSTHGKCHRIGTKAHYAFIYQSNEMFDFDEPVSVTVNATDLKNNVMDEYSYSFRAEMRSFGENKILSSGSSNDNWGPLTTVSDSSGNIWVAWPQGQVGSRDIYVGELVAGADSFVSSGVVQVTNDIPDQGNPVIAVDSSNKLYLAWQDNRYGEWDIFVSTSTDGIRWSTQTRVTDPNSDQINPAIAIDSSDKVYIAWEDDPNGNKDIYIASSTNNFVSKTTSRITSNTYDQTTPAIAVDSDDTVYVVWTDQRNVGGGKNPKPQNDIFGAASNDSWANIPIVTKEESQSNPAIATEAVGSVLHLVWLDNTNGDDDIFYAKTSGGLPASPLTGSSIIDDNTGADQISPVIIITGYTGNDLKVFACWRDERWADADLYFAEISSDYSAKISSGNKANVFVGDDGTNSDQSEPAIGIDGHGQPYLVWTNERTDICYAGSTFIESELASTNVSITSEATVGTMRNAIQSVDDVSAEVPQGAYLCDVKVTISRIKNPQKFNFNFEHSTGVYEFGPSGMEFTKPVTITIPYEVNGSENVSYKAYWYNSLTNTLSQEGITNVETIVISSNLHALRFKTTHFSPFILGGALGGLGGLLGGGGGGGCSMSPNSQDSIAELLLPYIGLAVAMVLLKLRDRRKRKAHNITKSGC